MNKILIKSTRTRLSFCGKRVHILIHQRFPVLFGVLLILFPLLAIKSAMLEGLMDAPSLFSMALISFFSIVCGWGARTMCFTIEAGAVDRFGLKDFEPKRDLIYQVIVSPFWMLVYHTTPIVALLYTTSDLGHWRWALFFGMLLGVSIGIFFIAIVVLLFITVHSESEGLKKILTIPYMDERYKEQENVLNRLAVSIFQFFMPVFLWSYELLDRAVHCFLYKRCNLSGFVVREGDTIRLKNEHRFLFLYSMVTGIGCFIFSLDYFTAESSGVALVMLIFVAYIILHIFSLIGFFFDRWNVPTLIPFILIWIGLTFLSKPTLDEVPRSNKDEQLSPNILLDEKRGDPEQDVVIVVSAEGGGIHAGVWTCHVLQEISDALKDSEETINFENSIVCMSGVSGGTYGLMHVLDNWNDGNVDFIKARKATEKSSLGQVLKGFLYSDLIPVKKGDRSRAIERAWASEMNDSAATIDSWSRKVVNGRMPAFLINSTIVETGLPIVFSTCDLSEYKFANSEQTIGHVGHFRDVYGDINFPISSAVRCSATFPYVTATAAIEPLAISSNLEYNKGKHMADGGYFDNTGVYSMIQFLEQALEENRNPPKVIFIKILEGDMASLKVPYKNKEKEVVHPPLNAFVNEVYGPLKAIFEVRSTGHRLFVQDLLDELIKKYPDTIVPIEFVYPYDNQPLSWHLTKSQKEEVENIDFTTSSVDHCKKTKQLYDNYVIFKESLTNSDGGE